MSNTESKTAKFGDMVRVHFTCSLEDGSVHDTSSGKEPLLLTIGENQFLPFFEKLIIGMKPGETKTFTVRAEDAYGTRDDNKIKTIERAGFPGDIQPEVGLQFQIERNDGEKSYIIVTEVSETNVTLDANHPMAGKDLHFEIELLTIVKPGPSAAQYFSIGVYLQDRDELDEAIKSYGKAIAIDPSMTEAYYNCGVACQKKGMLQEAIPFYQQVLELNPNHEKACLNLGISFKETGQYDEAEKYFERALQIKPDYDIAYYNLGNISYFNGRFEEARQFYEKAISINPEYADAHWNIALIDLLLGNYKDGWKGYEWRWKLEGLDLKKQISLPVWDGSDIRGKRLIIVTEQGFGDTIQFVRYIPMVKEQGIQVFFQCQKELIPLLQHRSDIQEVFELRSTLPEADFSCHLLSLSRIFDTTLENIPSSVPYILPSDAQIKKWGERIAEERGRLKIGIAWVGNPDLARSYYRSCTLQEFSPLMGLEGIVFYSLQKGEAANEANEIPKGLILTDYTNEINDFAETAGLLYNLDLVISIDTAVAHLAGAMGKPVWTLLPFIPDWRWLLDREDSPWYPTMRLFRQPSPGDWTSVISKVKHELAKMLKKMPSESPGQAGG
jgi:FKBP-type peptidyl-prolyl cis-trans isomerase 2